MEYPAIIQGGMGLGISNWRLAHSVAQAGQVGVVSGTCIDLIMQRRLQDGDADGSMRRGLAAFPDQDMASRVRQRWFIPGGRTTEQAYQAKGMVGHEPSDDSLELLIVASFVEVHLAKTGHDQRIGINFLNKIQPPLLASIYGAMLAGVDIIIVGAGIPFEIPALISKLQQHQAAEWKLQVAEAPRSSNYQLCFDPARHMTVFPEIERPLFFPIVSSAALAGLLVKKSAGGVDGLIVEHHSAGGHNAPPRGQRELNAAGEPIYGERDAIDLEAIAAFELPFWLAGSYGTPEQLRTALAAGAQGVQVGTLFAFCEESGLRDDLKRQVIDACLDGTPPPVYTSPVASPTGFPFKIPQVPGTLSDADLYAKRKRVCDLGYLREAYAREDGSIGWRCASEPIAQYERNNGSAENCHGRQCLCNALMANIGLGQRLGNDAEELPLLTCCDQVADIVNIIPQDGQSYTTAQVVEYLLSSMSTFRHPVTT